MVDVEMVTGKGSYKEFKKQLELAITFFKNLFEK